MATGEIRRAFFKHKTFGELIAVEIDDRGAVLAAADISSMAVIACRHMLPTYELGLTLAGEINKNSKDYEVVEPPCRDEKHQLRDIFEADREAERAKAEWEAADSEAKALKKVYEQHVEAARVIRHDFREPKELPLFPRTA